MENQYSYYTPEEDQKKKEKPKKKIPTWAKMICFGLIFGLVASVTFQAGNFIGGKLFGTGEEKTAKKAETVGSTKLTTSSDSTVNSDVAEIAKNAMPSVVSITNMSVQQVQNFFGGIQEQESTSAGSGIIISQNDSELLVLTNNHVVENSETLTVTFIDEESVEAVIKGTDATRDLAVVAVKLEDIKDSTMDEIAVATLGDSTQIQVGEPAIAIGNALGYGQSVTTGIISATGRTIDGYDSELIQTDAAINPGNSGGALLNAKGEVIGINTAKVATNAVEGMGYAIPVSDASDTITDLMNRETRTKVAEGEQGYLGIQGENVQMYSMPAGVYISEVAKGGGAAKAGLSKGSIITALEGVGVDDMSALKEQLQYYRVGETVKVTVQVLCEEGEYKEQTVEVTLGTKG
ncbi:trypsin-like peptidase domain-containing protein [Faecalicatena contorta]|uniref:S1C family serine protease n=1 Tax=Faecalicatena contorta TaxID=39482 RepID=UPI001F3DA884|nr:trypsin-like peptidase domain-containing protein [Faecalicatena contorta]MCF2680780.1 trypsin-like peptidase domain-containing protein [Faecalicatena contorta]